MVPFLVLCDRKRVGKMSDEEKFVIDNFAKLERETINEAEFAELRERGVPFLELNSFVSYARWKGKVLSLFDPSDKARYVA